MRLGSVWLWIAIDSYLDELQFWRRQASDVESYVNIFKISCAHSSVACQYTGGGVDVNNKYFAIDMIKKIKEDTKRCRFPTFSSLDEEYSFYSCYDCDGFYKNKTDEIQGEKNNWKEFQTVIKAHSDELKASKDTHLASVDRLYINHQILIESNALSITNGINISGCKFELDSIIMCKV
jgi:hypothetical protein